MTPRKPSRRERKAAKELLRMGIKVWRYRSDELPAEEESNLLLATKELQGALQDRSSTGRVLQEKATLLENALRKSGGAYYHKKNWVENVEMLLVAAIVILGIRSFFVQPFIIPTNSMYPSFYGMQPYIYEDEAPPNPFVRLMEKVFLGASHYRLDAESSGYLYLVLQNGGSHRYATANFPDGRFFILPSSVREYVFEIGGKEHLLHVPAEFDLDELLAEKFAGISDLRDLPLIIAQDHRIANGRMKLSENKLRKGDTALAFDVLIGDALFVDRMSYNFVRPKSGDPIVFRTAKIDQFNQELGTPAKARIGEDKYYIKRLVGEPGDTLEMKVPENIFSNGMDLRKGVPGILHRNGSPIVSSEASVKNNRQVSLFAQDPASEKLEGFPGYRADGLLSNQTLLRIPLNSDLNNPTKQNGYFAMGDNSTDSLDGRAWGFVPESQIIGKALFIYYPFTRRWGLSH